MNWMLRVLLTPSCWMRNHRTSYMFDEHLNVMLDNPQFSDLKRYEVTLNGQLFWIANYPYASPRPLNPDMDIMPTRKTVFRFMDELEKWRFSQGAQNEDKASTGTST